MSRKIIVLLATLVVLLHAASTNGTNSKEEHECEFNEYWSPCRASCQSTCGFPNGSICLKKTPGCVCQKGLVRSSNGECIDPSDCGEERRGPVLFRYGDSN